MITKANYGISIMRSVTKSFKKGVKQEMAERLKIKYTYICNVWSGKHFDRKVVAAIERASKQKKNLRTTA